MQYSVINTLYTEVSKSLTYFNPKSTTPISIYTSRNNICKCGFHVKLTSISMVIHFSDRTYWYHYTALNYREAIK
jgi:hypothetical protein